MFNTNPETFVKISPVDREITGREVGPLKKKKINKITTYSPFSG